MKAGTLKLLWGSLLLTVLLTLGVGLKAHTGTVDPGDDKEETTKEKVAADQPDERPIAFVRRFKPEVSIFNVSEQKLINTEKKAEQLYDGDTLLTKENGYAAVQFMDKSIAKVKPRSVLLINGSVDNQTRSTSTRIFMDKGEIMMDVEDQGNRSDFEVATSSSVATVKGTQFGTSADPGGESFHFVLEGSVEVTATQSGQSATINDGQFARVDQDGQDVETGELDEDELQKRRDEFDEVDKKMEPKKLEFQFEDENGEIQQIELEYFENDEQ